LTSQHAPAPHLTAYSHHRSEVDVLVTGVGMVATAAWCSRTLAQAPYDAALNLGVCGAFDPALVPGTVVHVISDRIAELGAEDDDRFLTLHELGLSHGDEVPGNGVMVNHEPPSFPSLRSLPPVVGITVNTVHGRESSIAAICRRLGPQVESMEGAAFMYACLIHRIPFAQVRAVSNVVERRNRDAWKLPEAIDSLCRTAVALLDEA
jgi:futalosine hydrolase